MIINHIHSMLARSTMFEIIAIDHPHLFFKFPYIVLLKWHIETTIICQKLPEHIDIPWVCLIHNKGIMKLPAPVTLLGLLNDIQTSLTLNGKTKRPVFWSIWSASWSSQYELWASMANSHHLWPLFHVQCIYNFVTLDGLLILLIRDSHTLQQNSCWKHHIYRVIDLAKLKLVSVSGFAVQMECTKPVSVVTECKEASRCVTAW